MRDVDDGEISETDATDSFIVSKSSVYSDDLFALMRKRRGLPREKRDARLLLLRVVRFGVQTF